MNLPVVTVCIITYNHANHIRQAIESVLAQQTSFQIEILIGEDSSTDGTQDIVYAYQKAHPELITVYRHSRNDVIYINGSPTGRWNYFDTLDHARGKYVAFIEGDDFWTDTSKLQKQYDALESNPDASLCGHWTKVVDQVGVDIDTPPMGALVPRIFTAKNALTSTPLHPNSFLFRTFKPIRHFSYPLLKKLPAADDPMSLILLGFGHGICLPEIMSAYRIHTGGTWSQKSELRQAFEMLQHQMNVPLMAPPILVPLSIYKTSYMILRFIAMFLIAMLTANKEPLQELLRVLSHQTAIGTGHLLFWIPVTVLLTPIQFLAFLYRKARR